MSQVLMRKWTFCQISEAFRSIMFIVKIKPQGFASLWHIQCHLLNWTQHHSWNWGYKFTYYGQELAGCVKMLRKSQFFSPRYLLSTCMSSVVFPYSAGQKFRTFNAMNFLWPPWERGANFECVGVWKTVADNHPQKMSQLQNSNINCPPLPKFTYLIQGG